jgi:hypothetical protein
MIAIQKAPFSPLERLYLRLSPQMRIAFLRAMTADIDMAALESAIARGDLTTINQLLVIPSAVQQEIAQVLTPAVAGGMETAASVFAATDFVANNPYVLQYAEHQAATLIQYLTESQRQMVHDILARGFQVALTPQEMAAEIARMVGLLPQHALAVLNFRLGLVEQGLSQARIERLADAYASRLRQYRANNIARTETMSALNAGEQQANEVLARAGVIDTIEYVKGWLIVSSDKTCMRCRLMNGQKVEIGESFVDPSTGARLKAPPLHSSCRCITEIVHRSESTYQSNVPAYVPDRRSLKPAV